MKKIVTAMSTVIVAVVLTACGAEEPEQAAGEKVAEEQVVEEQAAAEMVTKQLGEIAITVPAVFSDVVEQDEQFIVQAPNASIIVRPLDEVELLPTEWNQEVATESLDLYYSKLYSDMVLTAFEGNLELNGSPAVYIAFTGTISSGETYLVHTVRVFNKELTKQYFIVFTQEAGDENYTEDMNVEIIDSITLTTDVQ